MTETVLVVEVGGRAGRWACRSLAEAGFRVVGTAENPESAAGFGGMYSDVVFRHSSPERDGRDFLEELVGVVDREHVTAIMQSDNEAATQLLATFRGRTPAAVVGPDEEQFARLCDKSNLDVTARAAGLDSPHTVTVDAGGAADDMPSFPSIVKPAAGGTGAGERHIRQSAALVHTEDERAAHVQELLELTGAAIVQEHVAGTSWRIHFVASPDAFVALPVLTRRSNPREAGMSTVQYVPESAPAQIFSDAEKLIRQVSYVGPGSVQFIERAGRFYVHDVNLRLPASVAISIKAGLDMPRLAVECALGRYEALERVTLRRGVTYVWLGGEVRALQRGLRVPRRAPAAVVDFVAMVGGAVGPSNVVDRTPLRFRLRKLRSRAR